MGKGGSGPATRWPAGALQEGFLTTALGISTGAGRVPASAASQSPLAYWQINRGGAVWYVLTTKSLPVLTSRCGCSAPHLCSHQPYLKTTPTRSEERGVMPGAARRHPRSGSHRQRHDGYKSRLRFAMLLFPFWGVDHQLPFRLAAHLHWHAPYSASPDLHLPPLRLPFRTAVAVLPSKPRFARQVSLTNPSYQAGFLPAGTGYCEVAACGTLSQPQYP